MRMAGLLVAALLTACSPARRMESAQARGDRLDVLTAFTLALSKRDFKAATAMLAPEERARIVDAEGRVDAETQERLRALRLTTLVRNPLIAVSGGGICGIHGLLPFPSGAELQAGL